MKQKFDITGMSCAACSSRVEKCVRELDGVEKSDVSLMLNTLNAEYDPKRISAEDIISAVEKAGYGASPASDSAKKRSFGETDTGEMKKRLIVSVCLLIVLMYFSMGHMIGLPLPEFFHTPLGMTVSVTIQLIITLPILIVGRKYFTVGFSSLFRGSPNMDTLIAVGSSAAVIYGIIVLWRMWYAVISGNTDIVHTYAMDVYFESAAMIVTLVTVGKYLETRSKGRTGDAIRDLMDLSPKTAVIVRDGVKSEIPASQIKAGDIVAVKAGAGIPADGIIVSGSGTLDQSAITGESIPVEAAINSKAVSASKLISGYIEIKVTAAGNDTTLSKIIKLVEEAASSKAPIARLADKIAGIFVPAVMAIAVVAFSAWMIFNGNFEFALSVGIGVLVVSCPCALGLATPVAIMVGTGQGAKHGILIKSAEAMETAHKTDTVVMDKTGTLTMGKPEVTDEVLQGESSEKLRVAALTLEEKSEHPLARAITVYLNSKGYAPLESESFETVAGRGVKAQIEGKIFFAGNAEFMAENTVAIPEPGRFEKLLMQGKTVLYFAEENSLLGAYAVSDVLKPTSAAAVREFKAMGIETVMLTGDNALAANAVAKSAGIDEVIAGVLPADKANEVEKLKRQGKTVAMIGDGINDAPALTCADIGMAIGAGTDIAMESADMVLTRSDLNDAVGAVQLSRAVIRNVKMNLFWAFFYNTVGIPLAAGVLYPAFGIRLTPMFGAAAMSLSSVCVVLNALRLKNFRPKFRFTKTSSPIEPEKISKPENNNEINQKGNDTMTRKVIAINGMMCEHCAAHVKEALSALDGVDCTAVNVKEKYAQVEVTGVVTDDALMAAVKKAGYKPESVEDIKE